MIELAKHIEYLLLENDCVIVPDLGGFIAHQQPAHYEEEEGVFLPPMRTVGFNPQLKMNDGMLVQSYMQAYHTDFPDATRKIEQIVGKLKEQLYTEGMVELHGIGTLHYNIYGMYEFEPNKSGALSPTLYGLDSFNISMLSKKEEVKQSHEDITTSSSSTPAKVFHLNPSWIGNAAAVAIAIVMFFILSVPVENTYIDKGNYASLGTDCLFDDIRAHSMATTLTVSSVEPQRKKKEEIKPITVKVEKVAPAPKIEVNTNTQSVPTQEVTEAKKETKKMTQAEISNVVKKNAQQIKQKSYHIIVASLATSADAKQSLQTFKQKGFNDVSIVEGSGRFRISLCNYTDKSVAYQKLNELKQNDAFKNAWLLTSK